MGMIGSDPWAWRSNMDAQHPQDRRPELRAAPGPKYPTQNVQPMAYDALSALGVSHPTAQDYASRIGTAAGWTPPGFLADSAAGIGGPLGQGKIGEAAMNAMLLHSLGRGGAKLVEGLGPPLTKAARDAGMAQFLSRQPEAAAPRSMPQRGMEYPSDMGFISNVIPPAANQNQRFSILRHE